MVLSSTKAWLERLVAHETVSRDSNLTLIHEVAAFLAERGAHVELIHNEDGRKANCLARLGPERAGALFSQVTQMLFRLMVNHGRPIPLRSTKRVDDFMDVACVT